MPTAHGITLRILTIVLAIIVAALVVLTFTRKAPNPVIPSTQTTAPATTTVAIAATEPSAPAAPKTFLDVVRRLNPDFPTTQPLEESLELRDAAAILVSDPVYLCPRGDLWVTSPDAVPLVTTLSTAYDDRDHVVPEKVLFVHWQGNDDGQWLPHLIVPSTAGAELILPPISHLHIRHSSDPTAPLPALKRLSLPNRNYDFAAAFSYNDRIVIPTPTGVSVLKIDKDKIRDDFQDLASSIKIQNSIPARRDENPVVLLDTRGLLAFVPNASPTYRYVDDHWTPIPNWPDKVLHLIPLLDGSVLQILSRENDKVELHLAILDQPQINADHIASLVDDLSDPLDTKRNAAFDELSRYGSGLWPILEKLLPNQPPESKIRLRQLLKNKITPTLGGFSIVNNQLRLISRYAGGGALFYADAGVTSSDATDRSQLTPAAWLAAIPGQPVTLLSHNLTRDLQADSPTSKLYSQGNEWILSDDVHGPRRFNGVSLSPVLRKPYLNFTGFSGKDHAGRWLFRNPAQPTSTLVLDPTLPDPTPRLPVWTFPAPSGGTVGWDNHDWPVLKSGGAFAVEVAGYRNLTNKDHFFSTYTPPAVVAASPTTLPSSLPSTTQSTQPAALGPPLLVTPEGTYYDGLQNLTFVSRDNHAIVWPLPPAATGTLSKPWLIETADHHLFLYNQPGRILRIRSNLKLNLNSQSAIPNPQSPFTFEATFAHKIPNADRPTRIWLDPAGRIVIANNSTLSILFASGRIPRPTINIMPTDQLEELEQ